MPRFRCTTGLAVRHLTASISLLLAAATQAAAVSSDPEMRATGRRIYEQGLLPSRQPLQAARPGGITLSGREAACIQCHQRSGMGFTEGAVPIPPVTGPVLFRNERAAGAVPRRAKGIEFKDQPFKTRPAYDDASLSRAIVEGVSPTGYRFIDLMPRYRLAPEYMQALIAYLRTLSATPSPGADETAAHFATVVASETDPKLRDAYLGVLQACFRQHEPKSEAMEPAKKPRQTWRLHLWQLEGFPQTWRSQLEGFYARQPVFALVSGLGTDEWAPVHRFCEQNGVPCLFPNVETPGSLDEGIYNFYFSAGVLLEAQVAAHYLLEQRESSALARVVQLSRPMGSGRRAAEELQRRLEDSGMVVEIRDFLDTQSAEAAPPLADLGARDALILWLKEADLVHLAQRTPAPPSAGLLLSSGLLAGLEDTPLPSAWRKPLAMLYPYDPPARRNLRMSYNLRPWLTQQRLPQVDERLQGNTLAACNLLTEGMLRLRGRYQRDYLVELIENYPSAMGNAPAAEAYPHFSLGTGQRFSSKGAYIARFAAPDSQRLEQAADWIVP